MRAPEVLLVGDKSAAAELGRVLASLAQVTAAESVAEALERIGQSPPGAAFCVRGCQEECWRRLLRGIRARGLNLPVIVVDRCGDEHEWVQVLESGAFDLLVPPYSPAQVQALLLQILEQHEPLRSGVRKTASFV